MMENNQEHDLQPRFNQLNMRSENSNGANSESFKNLKSQLEFVKENSELKIKNLEHEKKEKEFEQTIATLTQECAKLKAENENLKKVNSCFHESCTSLTEATTTLTEKVKELSAKNSEMVSREAYCDLAKENFQLDDEVKSLELALKITNRNVDKTSEELYRMEEKLQIIEKDYRDLRMETKDYLHVNYHFDPTIMCTISRYGWIALLKLIFGVFE